MVRKGEKQKGGQLKPGESQPSILSFLTPALAVFSSVSATTETMETVNGASMENGKKRPLDKGNEKVSPEGK